MAKVEGDHSRWVPMIAAKRGKAGPQAGFFYNQDEGRNGKATILALVQGKGHTTAPKALQGNK